MKVRQIAEAIERLAPLRLQEEYDNSGLQVGFPSAEVGGVLVSLDITEKVIDEAVARGCDMVVSHHPLLFHPLRMVSDSKWQQRCVVKALSSGVVLYSAHTNLDNARGGVNFKMAHKLGLEGLEWLRPMEGEDAGSGLVGTLKGEMPAADFLQMVRSVFDAPCLKHTPAADGTVRKVALCGGAGAFLIGDALRKGADCFITGEMRYHDFFDGEGMLLVETGHYQSEQYTVELLRDCLHAAFPGLRMEMAGSTDPAEYTIG